MCAEYVIDDQALFDAAVARLQGREPKPEELQRHGAVGFINNLEQRFDHDGGCREIDVTMRVRYTDSNRDAISRMLETMAMVELVERRR